MAPLLKEKIAKEEEIDKHFEEKYMIKKFNSMQDVLIAFIADHIFYNQLEANGSVPLQSRFERPFVELNINLILNEMFLCFDMITEDM
jgi:hypothetical protein